MTPTNRRQISLQRRLGVLFGMALLAALFILMGMLSSCSKGNNMGPLRGQWQLLTIEYPDGTVTAPQPDDVRYYISFDLKVIQLTSTHDESINFYKLAGSVSGETPDLTFYFPYDDGDQPGTALLRLWGIDENPAKVTVETLNDNRLVMKVGPNTLTLRKF